MLQTQLEREDLTVFLNFYSRGVFLNMKLLVFIIQKIWNVIRNNKGANEIIGSALLIVFLVLQAIPALTQCSVTVDNLLNAIDTKMKQQMQAVPYNGSSGSSSGSSGGSSGSSGSTNNVVVTYSGYNPSTDNMYVPASMDNWQAWDVPIPSNTPAGAKYVDFSVTFHLILYNAGGYPFYEGDFTATTTYDVNDGSGVSQPVTIYGSQVTGMFEPYIVDYGNLSSGYTVAFSLWAGNGFSDYGVNIYPTNATITFRY